MSWVQTVMRQVRLTLLIKCCCNSNQKIIKCVRHMIHKQLCKLIMVYYTYSHWHVCGSVFTRLAQSCLLKNVWYTIINGCNLLRKGQMQTFISFENLKHPSKLFYIKKQNFLTLSSQKEKAKTVKFLMFFKKL